MRKPWLLNLILLVAIAAAGVRLSSAWRAPLPELPGEPAAPESVPAAAAPAVAVAAEEKPGQYEGIVARDLFSATRGVIPPQPVKPSAAVPQAPKAAPPKLTLFGVVIIDGEKSAYLQEGPAEAKPRKVQEGDTFAGGKVKAIRPDGVTMQFASGDVQVALRAPKEGLAPIAFPMQPPQVPQAAVGMPTPGVPPQQPVMIPRPQPPGVAGQPVLPRGVRPEQVPSEEIPLDEEAIPDEEYYQEDEEALPDDEFPEEGDMEEFPEEDPDADVQ